MKVRSLSLTCDYLIDKMMMECLPCCYHGALRKEYQRQIWAAYAERMGFENLSYYLKLCLENDIKVVGMKK